MKRIRFGRSVKFTLLTAIATLFCIFTPPVLGAIQPPQNPPTFGTPLLKGGRGDQSPPILGDLGGSRASTLDQQARSLYTNGRYSEAAIAFQEAAQAYQAQGDSIRQGLAFGNLALTYQQLGAWAEANAAIAQSVELLRDQGAELAQVLDIQGTLQLAQGQATQALDSWERATAIYTQLGDSERAIASQVNQAQALQALGLYRRAITTLITALDLENELLNPDRTETDIPPLETVSATTTHAAALRSLGEALRVTGNLQQARAVLERGLAIAQELNDREAIAATQFALANVIYGQALSDLSLREVILTPAEAADLIRQRATGRLIRGIEYALAFETQLQRAITLYEQSADTSAIATTRVQSRLNQLNLLIVGEQWSEAIALIAPLTQQTQALPVSRTAIYAQINLAENVMKLHDQRVGNANLNSYVAYAKQILTRALQQAEALQDQRSRSYALGVLGSVYEQTEEWEQAKSLTRQALLQAQEIEASDISYRWQWQLGRLLKTQGQTDAAIAAYKEAVNTLKLIRSDLIAITPEEQFSFRETIEPIHRELVALLLESDQGNPSSENLTTARDVIESLQLAELDNFFREACLTAQPELVDELVDNETAVLYPILLPDRLAVVVKLPGQDLTYYATPLDARATPENIASTVNQVQRFIRQTGFNESRYLPLMQQLYDWLICPIAPQLQSSGTKTLVFVLDGALRNVPMSVLHDGNQYLIEQYAIALTPGLQLLESRPLFQERLRALVAGLSEARAGFEPLTGVDSELQQIGSQIQDSRVLLNQEFTNNNFETALNAVPFPVVHLATHGKFSSRLQETYILTYDDRLDINQLRTLLQATEIREGGALELLVLSACETAAGDDRATLGLAGMAVRSGARSTVATLWQVGDKSTSLMMSQFYQQLAQPNISKAVALQEAQLALLKSDEFNNPFYWAPYVLIGNWQ
ncbi:CHAT domain-containing protein [Oscillatoria sp. FACHB-1407]|uniref:CHAT domain-containing protein n=1 Tax=Oscillatoria sp. FACHB-1407 TaxID=2692847 RepID=UPI001687B98E|nr:CHAT domain-containing protein [Oscillatoria sp. FACHB-1407]MBD2463037.1 CHAT domain-containing protein [Oscillatoria sp. FACHB-1407]